MKCYLELSFYLFLVSLINYRVYVSIPAWKIVLQRSYVTIYFLYFHILSQVLYQQMANVLVFWLVINKPLKLSVLKQQFIMFHGSGGCLSSAAWIFLGVFHIIGVIVAEAGVTWRCDWLISKKAHSHICIDAHSWLSSAGAVSWGLQVWILQVA